MIPYSYCCMSCLYEFEEYYDMGKAPRYLSCPKCLKNSERIYGNVSIGISNPTHPARKGRGQG